MRPRFRIAGLLAAIVLAGVAFAALRSPSYLWANTVYTAACVALLVAAIHAALGHGRPRAFWAGFLMAGGSYFVVYSVPSLRESICPRLLSEPLLDLLYTQAAPPPARPTGPSGAGMGGGMPGPDRGAMGSGGMLSTMMAGYGSPTPPPPAPPSRWAAWTEPDRTSGVGYQIGTIALVSPEPFRQVGHSLLILAFGALGGLYARHRFGGGSR